MAHDTAPGGQTNSDGITSDSTITGTVTSASPIGSFRAGFDSTPLASFLDVTSDLTAGHSFQFSPSRLVQILGAPLPDGPHTLHLQAADDQGKASDIFNLPFTLDTQPPAVAIQSPAQGLVVEQNVTIAGTEDESQPSNVGWQIACSR